MKIITYSIIINLVLLIVAMTAFGQPGNFLRLHPQNQHYFEFRGEPQVLITAGEHYGSIQNLDFDFKIYLDLLQEHGFNQTRIFLFFREPETEFEGSLGYQNTLAPRPGRWCVPWQRSSTPGAADGGNKFDLNLWNDAFFERLQNFCIEAGKRNVIVEVVLFCQYYSSPSASWELSPLNASNNINGVGNIDGRNFLTLQDKAVVEKQTAFVRKVVQTLRDFDNIYYEICNEPNWTTTESVGNDDIQYLTVDWHQHIITLIQDTESDYQRQHLIAVNIDDKWPNDKVRSLEGASVLNFHYKKNAMEALRKYLDMGLPISFDETLSGIIAWNPSLDFNSRRKEAWEFILNGGTVYSYLDVTIATDDETGTGQAAFPGKKPMHYDGQIMRLYLKYLIQFIGELNMIFMQPDKSILIAAPETANIAMMANPGVAYAGHFSGAAEKKISLRLPKGEYTAAWYDTSKGKWELIGNPLIGSKVVELVVPAYLGDAALMIRRNDFKVE